MTKLSEMTLGELDPPAAEVMPAVMELLQTGHKLDLKRLVESHPELLSETAEWLLEDGRRRFLRDRDKGDRRASAHIEVFDERLELLRRCRALGVENAFASVLPTPPEQIFAVLTQFLGTDSWAQAKEFVTEHPEVLGDVAQEMLSQFIANAEQDGNKDAASNIALHRQVLRRARVIGVNAAFAEMKE